MNRSIIFAGLAACALLAGCQSVQYESNQQSIETVIAQELAVPEDEFKQERDASITAAEASRAGSGIREKAYIHVIDNRHYQDNGLSTTDLTNYLPPKENLQLLKTQKRQALRAKGVTRDQSVYAKDQSVYRR